MCLSLNKYLTINLHLKHTLGHNPNLILIIHRCLKTILTNAVLGLLIKDKKYFTAIPFIIIIVTRVFFKTKVVKELCRSKLCVYTILYVPIWLPKQQRAQRINLLLGKWSPD